MPEQLMICDPPRVDPGLRGRAWRGAAYLAALLACLGITIAFLVTIVIPSAGAAGGCGGG
ncbi:MAG TPA: hypothetical protein VMC83_37245 [Streptosporangiaceae bacterium]|nr:hypothetical protein [Streptosporangiaceae bacterium]